MIWQTGGRAQSQEGVLNQAGTRNWCIVAHTDRGASTLPNWVTGRGKVLVPGLKDRVPRHLFAALIQELSRATGHRPLDGQRPGLQRAGQMPRRRHGQMWSVEEQGQRGK